VCVLIRTHIISQKEKEVINIRLCVKCMKGYLDKTDRLPPLFNKTSGSGCWISGAPIKFRYNERYDKIYRTVWIECPYHKCETNTSATLNCKDKIPESCPYYTEQVLTADELASMDDLEINAIATEMVSYPNKQDKEDGFIWDLFMSVVGKLWGKSYVQKLKEYVEKNKHRMVWDG
jgi:hypothetical protein